MSVWKLYASGSGSFVIAVNLILLIIFNLKVSKRIIDTPLKMKIAMILFNIIVIIIVIIILASTLKNKSKAVLEIVSFIIYIFLVYFLIRFFQEYKANKKKMVNQIYIYSYKFMPMLKFQSSGSGANGEMVENNSEQMYFLICSIGFMFWALLSGLLLDDSYKYIAFSLSSLGLILIFLYIITRVHQGRSLKINDLLIIERDHYLDLQKQALIYRDRQKNLSKDVIYKNQYDKEALNKISEERETILTRHKEWISLLTVLSQKCHSKLKCGSENARPQEPFKLEEVHQVERDFNLNHSLINKIFILKKTSERADLEYFNFTKYKAYMKGLLILKINNHQEDIVSKVESRLREMKTLMSRFSTNPKYKQYSAKINSELFINLSSSEDFKIFNDFYNEFKRFKLERDKRIQDLRKEEDQRNKEREALDRIKYLREESERKRFQEENDKLLNKILENEEERKRIMNDEYQRHQDNLRKQEEEINQYRELLESSKKAKDEERIKIEEERKEFERVHLKEEEEKEVDNQQVVIETDFGKSKF